MDNTDFLAFKAVYAYLEPELALINWSLFDFYDSIINEFDVDYFDDDGWSYEITVWQVHNALETIIDNPSGFE